METLSRREMMKTTGAAIAAAGLGAQFGVSRTHAAEPLKELRILQVGVHGIANMDRNNILKHPKAKIVGLCDVNATNLDRMAKQLPDAFTVKDYRRAFADHADEFDAVNVCTPDHSHAMPILLSLKHDKHCYAQKPLVQQLEELVMLDEAQKAKPHLATQTGNQRMNSEGRRLAVEILKNNRLGQAVEVYAWTGTQRGSAKPIDKFAEIPVPDDLDWDLWQGPCEPKPLHNKCVPNLWRAWWDYGTGGLGDWGVHLLDIVMYSYPELVSPYSVVTHTPRAADWYHTTLCQATMCYQVDSDRFLFDRFPVHYNDSGMTPNLHAIGIPKDSLKANMTAVVCTEGTLLLTAGGDLTIYRKGKEVDLSEFSDVALPAPSNHWHAWIDQAMGVKDHGKVYTPFDVGVRITEAAILPGKASRFPSQELLWDRKNLVFTNHQEATDTVVRRKYRDGFAPPKVS